MLYSFKGGSDGGNPDAGLISDAAGNLYSTTNRGGDLSQCSPGCGTVFTLTPNADGSWTESVLHFQGHQLVILQTASSLTRPVISMARPHRRRS